MSCNWGRPPFVFAASKLNGPANFGGDDTLKSMKFKEIIIFMRIKQYIELKRHIKITLEGNSLFQIHGYPRADIVGSPDMSKFDTVMKFVILLCSKGVIGIIQ